MFDNLSEKLQRSFKTLRGQGTLTDENINDALREIRLAFIEADVNLDVTRELIEKIRAKALGAEVATSLSPAEQIVKIVRDELIATLGTDTAKFKFAPQPPTVILMAGLQGSGKTTTSGKLAAWLKKGGHRPLLVSVDVYRPAAREQLAIVAKTVGVQIYEGALTLPTNLSSRPEREARSGETPVFADASAAGGGSASPGPSTTNLSSRPEREARSGETPVFADASAAGGGSASPGPSTTNLSSFAAGGGSASPGPSTTNSSSRPEREARSGETPVFADASAAGTSASTAEVLRLAKAAYKEARDYANDVLIVDTAGPSRGR